MRVRFVHRAVFVLWLICQLSICPANEIPDPNNSTKYLDAVRESDDDASEVLHRDTQDYVFPDANELPSQKGLPDPFIMSDGSRVKTKEDWRKQRDYLRAMLTYYQYGHMPPKPKDIMTRGRTSTTIYGGHAMWTTLEIVISRKGKELRIRAGMLRPNKPGKYPVIIKNDEFLFDASEIEQPEIRRIYEGRREQIDEVVRREAMKRSYVICKFIRTDLALDDLEHRNNRDAGIFTLYPQYDWGTIAAWAWGYQVVLDILKQELCIDMNKIAATGHARGGKAALCAGIYDERILITAPHVSGTGGAGSWRFFDPERPPLGLLVYRVWGGEYFWVPRLFSFTGREDRMPFDAHFAKALIAPRVFLNTYAREDYSPNPYGAYLTHLAAQSVFKLLGVEENCLIHWRDGSDHNQTEEDWLALFDVCDKGFFGKEINRRFNDNPFPRLYQFDVPVDLNSGGITSLHWAVELGRKDLVELLIARGVAINVKNSRGQTPLDIAIRRNREDIIELLITKGARTPSIHMAVQAGVLTAVKTFLEEGVDINLKDNRGNTPLHYAVEQGHKDIVELLLAKGADVNAEPGNQTPLHWAIGQQHKEMIEWLLARGANPNADGGDYWGTPLHWAVWWWDVDTALLLVSHGSDIHLKTQKYPYSPLFDSVLQGHPAMAEALVTKTGDTRAAKWAPLLATAASGDLQAMEDMLAKGTDVNAKSERGLSALHSAAVFGHKDIVELLIEKGADVNAKAERSMWDEGMTALHGSCLKGGKGVAELLIAKEADVNAKTKNGYTPLHVAVARGYRDVAELLVDRGADVNAKSNEGETPLSIAEEEGRTEIVELLRKHGAEE